MNTLYRSTENRMIAGVAGGMAECANIDVALMRLIWVVAFLAGGVGFLAYIICWIIIPERSGMPNEENHHNENGQPIDNLNQRMNSRRNAGFILIGLGFIFLIKNFIPWHYWDKGWPLILVAVGLYILLNNKKGDQA